MTDEDAAFLTGMFRAVDYMTEEEEKKGIVTIEEMLRWEASMTMDVNPKNYKGHDSFKKYLKNENISSFGDWMFYNGYNLALTQLRVHLKKKAGKI